MSDKNTYECPLQWKLQAVCYRASAAEGEGCRGDPSKCDNERLPRHSAVRASMTRTLQQC